MLDDTGFRTLFAGTPIKRTGRNRFLRNVLIALGNSGEAESVTIVQSHLDDPDPLVRGAAVWALSRLMPAADFLSLAAIRVKREDSLQVQNEWRHAEAECKGLTPDSKG